MSFIRSIATTKCSIKKALIKVLQSSHENNCAGVSFLLMFQAEGLLKSESDLGSWEFRELLGIL